MSRHMVRKERLELSRVAPLEPKSSASTNSATLATCAPPATWWVETETVTRPKHPTRRIWGERWDSNPRLPESQSGALPTELRSPCLSQAFILPNHSTSTAGAPDRTRTCNLRLSLPATAFAAPPKTGFGVWTLSSPSQVEHV